MSVTTDFEREYIRDMLNAKELCDFLAYNDNIDDPEFEKLWNKIEANISTAQIVDSYLHRKDFKNLVDNTINPDNLAVLWKKPFKTAKIGDIINGGKVVGVFTLTIWIENLKDNYHEHCCK